jgi:soluble lytic murein transglycosylase-like protein
MKICSTPPYLLHSLLSILILMLLVCAPVRADVWGYIDNKGVAHFASEKLDERYELYFKGPTVFDTQEAAKAATAALPAQPEPATPRPVAVPAGKSKLLAFFEISPNFKAVRQHMRDASKKHNIDFELLQALIATESGFDSNAVSPKGAVGLMQLMPPTAQRFGVVGDEKTPIEKKLTDPKTNIAAGTQYLRLLINMFPGKLELALAAYNAGEGAVQRYGNKIPPFKETQNYVATVMQIYQQLKPPTLPKLPQHSGRVAMEMRVPSHSPAGAPIDGLSPTPGGLPGARATGMPGRANMVPPLTALPGTAPGTAANPIATKDSKIDK